MRQELEDKLLKKYPKIFNGTLIGHIDIGDGWYNLLDRLEHTIQYVIDNTPGIPQLQAVRIKEQCGSLRVVYIGGDRQIWNLINQAEEMSVSICEECGKPARINVYGHKLKCRCPAHQKELQNE